MLIAIPEPQRFKALEMEHERLRHAETKELMRIQMEKSRRDEEQEKERRLEEQEKERRREEQEKERRREEQERENTKFSETVVCFTRNARG